MTCANHQELEATAYCRECGKAMCGDCQFRALGSVYCGEHAPATVTVTPELPAPPSDMPEQPRSYQAFASAAPPPPASPYTAAEPAVQCDTSSRPALAFLLGFIPGVGAIYNGQYAKGLIHAVVFGLLVTIQARGVGGLEPLVGMMIAAWVGYMVFEAYHTAQKRRKGLAVDEFSSLVDMNAAQGRFPVGAVLLIGIGFILLLDTTDIINMEQLSRYWPVGLIGLGVYMLYGRLAGPRTASPNQSADKRAEVR